MNRNSGAAIAALVFVGTVAALGFCVLGGPGHERRVHQDIRSVESLSNLAQEINESWASSGEVLPNNLDRFPADATRDSATHAPFVYHPRVGSHYELCAAFLTSNREEQQNEGFFWRHPKGEYCFQLDASVRAPQAPFMYYY